MSSQNGLGMMVLRAWMWFVPIVMLITAGGFGVYAVVAGRWVLLIMMFVMALFGLGLLVTHYWVLYRFGKDRPG